jgi:L-fuculose-phosphate aldolase
MYTNVPDGLGPARTELVRHGNRLLADGLSIGSAGNLSVRVGDVVAITPSGVAYPLMRAADICVVTLQGAQLADDEAKRKTPSSETPMHLAIYAATGAAAVVHTHSPEVIALSAARRELPAIGSRRTRGSGRRSWPMPPSPPSTAAAPSSCATTGR